MISRTLAAWRIFQTKPWNKITSDVAELVDWTHMGGCSDER